MNFQILIFILLISFLPLSFANNFSIKKRDLNIFGWNGKVKREIDLEVFSNIKDVKKNESDTDDDIINVCGNEEEVKCSCNLGQLSCTTFLNGDLKTLNLRPIVEDFVIEDVRLWNIKNLTLEKDKILPGNEKTIKKITFTEINFIKVDNNIFDSFTSLESLFFRETTLSSLNENLLTEKLGNTLLEFICFGCRLRNIDLTVFKNLVNLHELNLNSNKQINGKFEGKFPKSLSKLKILNLGFCNLTFLADDTFEHLKSLEELNLSYNKFDSIPSAIRTSLKKFIFNRNELKELKQNDFSPNINLEILYFMGNRELETVESCAFCNFKILKQISFMGCEKLTYINENAFGAISNGYSPKLEEFDIVDCNISVLHENLLDWKNVGGLHLSGNPFACNCSMAWLFNDLMSNNSIYESKLTYYRYYPDKSHKFYLGCLGPPPTTRNHTFPYTIVEIFSSCKNNLSSSNNFLYFLLFFGLISLAVIFVYSNKLRLGNLLQRYF